MCYHFVQVHIITLTIFSIIILKNHVRNNMFDMSKYIHYAEIERVPVAYNVKNIISDSCEFALEPTQFLN